ncbi:MAG: PDDEXK nuclease domain-containing protein [Bacteroidia bacterium]|nr:PDDEXK nuclease domain-containing protein [Bacteroidia bacterium]
MKEFSQIVQIIHSARVRSLSVANSELVNVYWQIGNYISIRLESALWGEGAVKQLAQYIQKNHPELKGFDRANLYRMCQFYQTYRKEAIVVPVERQLQTPKYETDIIVVPVEPPLAPQADAVELSDIRGTILAQISWSLHLILMGRCKQPEEREFYLRLSIREHYSKRELNRQIDSSAFERTMIGNAKLPESVKKLPQDMTNAFKDSYVFEFLNLPEPYIENDLRKALLNELKRRDFRIDLLFFHRGLQCLVAFELKTTRFEPEYLGKTNFYLEALDRDVRKPHENPSIGVLLCKDRDEEVVEYALSRSLSPTMVAQYLTILPEKKLLQQKLHELFDNQN